MLKNFVRTGQTEPYAFSLYIGCFAGLFASLIRLAAHFLRFTPFDNSFLIYDMFINLEQSDLLVQLLGGVSFIILSIIASIIYMLLFRNKKGPMWGIGYGLCWWLLLFIVLPYVISWPTRGMVMELETQAFEACLFIIWGLFIGYSIAFEFTDEAKHEPIYAK